MDAEAQKAKLHISLLGAPVVLNENTPLVIPRRLTRALLFYLACQTQPTSRMVLCNLFWPVSTEEQARKNLREQLSLLRRALADDSLIITDVDQVSLDHSQVNVDYIQFSEIVSQVHASIEMMPTGKLSEPLYRALRAGVDLWRTPYFMQGFEIDKLAEYESWLFRSRQYIEYWRQNFAERLADHSIYVGKLDEAILWLRSALIADPLNTDLHYLLLTCLRDLGRKSEILRYGEYLHQIYTREHDEPVPQLLSDYLTRLDNSFIVSAVQQKNDWPGMSYSRPQFVGRRELFSQLNHYLHQGGITIIQGEPGMGKTRLLEEYYARLEVPVRLIYFSPIPADRPIPYQTLIKGLKQQVSREEWESFAPADVELIGQYFPGLFSQDNAEIIPSENCYKTETSQKIQLSLAAIFRQMAQKKHLLIILDNAHFCDAESFSFLAFLNKEGFFRSEGFLLISSRIDEDNRYLDEFIFQNQVLENFHQFILGGLTENEVATLVYHVTGRVVPEVVIQRLTRDSGGIPLVLLEILKSLMDSSVNLDEISTVEHFSLPVCIQDLIQTRVQQADKDTRMVLSAAAILGPKFTPDLVEETTQLSRERVVESLEKLVRAHAISIQSDYSPAGGYGFNYDNIRETFVSSMDPAVKRLLALRAVDALRSKFSDESSVSNQCAKLYELAGESKLAFEEWHKAALFAQQRYRRDEAVNAYEHAFALCIQCENLFSDQEVMKFFNSYADFVYDLEDSFSCDKIYQKCMTIGEKRRSSLLIGNALSGFAIVASMRGQISRGLDFISLACKYLAKSGAEGEIIEAYTRQGILYWNDNDFRKSRECFEKAVAYPVKQKTRSTRHAIYHARMRLSALYCYMGTPLKGAEQVFAVSSDSELMQSDSTVSQERAMLALTNLYMGKYHAAVEAARSALQITEQLQQNWWNAFLTAILARSYFCTGYLDEGWAMSERSLQYSDACEQNHTSLRSLSVRGDFFRYLGDYPQAEEYYRKGIDTVRSDFQSLECTYMLGYTMGMHGNYEGIHYIKSAIKSARRLGLGLVTIPAEITLLYLGFRSNTLIPTRLRLQKHLALATNSGIGTVPVLIHLTAAEIWAAQGVYSKAEEEYQQAGIEAREMLNPWLELRANRRILSDIRFSDETRHQAEIRTRSIFDSLAEHANTHPSKEKLEAFRLQWEEDRI